MTFDRKEEVERRLRARIERNMSQAVLYAKGQAQRLVNRGNADGSSPSLPGEPPKKVSSLLFQSFATRVRSERSAVVGVLSNNAEYARRLELGFTGTDSRGRVVDQAPRPFLRRSVLDNRRVLGRIIGQ